MAAEYDVSITLNKKTGAITAVYFQFRSGKAAKTKEYANGVVLADYNARGKLIGVEMLGPCRTSVLKKIQLEQPVIDFIRQKAPRELVPL